LTSTRVSTRATAAARLARSLLARHRTNTTMFAHTIVRVRAVHPGDASVAAHRFLDAVGDANNGFALLLVCSYSIGVRALLVDKTDWRRRDREAEELRRELTTRDEMIGYAKKIRFQELFLLLGATRSRHERAIYEALRDEYLTGVDSPAKEEVFLRATDDIVREVLSLSMDDVASYQERRKETAKKLLDHSTDQSFPFVTATGLDLYEARLFDIGGEGPEHYVIASVHV
jgi:hypothetical protein